ncbi:MAG: Spy/CpxP family protein refolding chaperone [Acidobacteria bacterium]|nr:Spy/CpxP family protein refolding chaperone [Acidobacteriota bacterium]
MITANTRKSNFGNVINRIAVAAGALVLTSGLAGLALAGPGGPGRGGEHGGMGPGMRPGLHAALRHLDLSDTQKEQIKAKLEAAKPNFQALRDQGKLDRDALKALLDAPNPDKQAVGEATIRLHQHREAVRAEMERTRAEIDALLTPEQREKLADMRERRQERRERRGRGMGAF